MWDVATPAMHAAAHRIARQVMREREQRRASLFQRLVRLTGRDERSGRNSPARTRLLSAMIADYNAAHDPAMQELRSRGLR